MNKEVKTNKILGKQLLQISSYHRAGLNILSPSKVIYFYAKWLLKSTEQYGHSFIL